MNSVLSRILLAACVVLVTTVDVDANDAARKPTLRAGAATSNITPRLGVSINGGFADRRAQHIHDELLARCLVIESGKTRLVIVSCDSCMISRETFDLAKTYVKEATGIPTNRVLMAATHTHSAATACGVFQSDPDEEYLAFLARRIADGVRRAHANLEPARVGWGTGSVPGEVFNRRWYLKPGKMPAGPFPGKTDRVKMNPRRASPDLVEPAGPTDPTVSIVSFVDATGAPIALLANYSLHYVGGTGAGHISADYFGEFAKRIEADLGDAKRGAPFVAMLTNGTSGDINNIDFRKKSVARKPYEQIRHVSGRVAGETLRVFRGIDHRDSIPISMRETTIRLGVRRPSVEDLNDARAVLAKAESEGRGGRDGKPLRGYREVYARETVLLADYPPHVDLKLQAIRLGEVAICAIPCEVFVEIGLKLRNRSPLSTTFTIELANGYNGYLPTRRQHALGGYETWRARSSYLEVDASRKIIDKLSPMLREIANTDER